MSTKKTDSKRYDSDRGAAITEYALLLALVVVVSIGAINFLTDSSGELLDDVAVDIATPRDFEEVLVEAQLTPPPAFVPTPLPTTLTWADKPISTAEGCLTVTSPTLGIVACDQPTATSFNGLSPDGVNVTISVLDDSDCLTGDNSGPAPVVSMTPCGGPGQGWQEVSSAGTIATYTHVDSGLCLQTVVPGGANPLTLAPCDGSPAQTIEVRF